MAEADKLLSNNSVAETVDDPIARHALDDPIARYALRRRSIASSASQLKGEIVRARIAYEQGSDNQADNFANYLKACRIHIKSLEEQFLNFGEPGLPSRCLCDPEIFGAWVWAEDLFKSLKTLVWESWVNILKGPQGEKHPFLRDFIQLVQGLPVIKITQNHLSSSGNIRCEICLSYSFQVGEEAHHLPCNKAHIFHRRCIEEACLWIAGVNDEACELRTEILRQKIAYEADPDNQADDFAYQLYVLQGVIDVLQDRFYQVRVRIDNCVGGHSMNIECKMYRNQIRMIGLVIAQVIHLIWESWLRSGLRERVERQMENEIVELVGGFPVIKIVDKDVECTICLSNFEVGEEPICHLSCNEGHMFHRNCIEQWLNRKNQCPICRKPAYCPRHYFYPSVLERLEWLVNRWSLSALLA